MDAGKNVPTVEIFQKGHYVLISHATFIGPIQLDENGIPKFGGPFKVIRHDVPAHGQGAK